MKHWFYTFMERGSVIWYTEIESYLKKGKGPSYIQSNVLLGCTVKMFWLFRHTFLHMFRCGVSLTPLANFHFIFPCASWDNLASCDSIYQIYFSQALPAGTHCSYNRILPYVGLYTEFAWNRDPPMDTWFLLVYKNLAVGSIAFQPYW